MPDLLLIDFETVGLEDRTPLQVHAKLLRWDNRSLTELGVYGDYYESDKDPEEWGAVEFHRTSGFLETWEGKSKAPLSDLGPSLSALLDLSVSQSKPLLCARNVAFELSVIEEQCPEILGKMHRYRRIDLTTLNLHPDLNHIQRELRSQAGVHHADEDVEIEHILLLEFLSLR